MRYSMSGFRRSRSSRSRPCRPRPGALLGDGRHLREAPLHQTGEAVRLFLFRFLLEFVRQARPIATSRRDGGS